VDVQRDERYLSIILEPIRVCADYKPRMGHGPEGGLSLADFQQMYRSDAFYCWFGLDNPAMYAAHKAAGGMTSIYRQIGIGCEHLFREILKDELNLSDDQVNWSYAVRRAHRKARRLSLDARIPLTGLVDHAKQVRVRDWVAAVSRDLRINRRIVSSLEGVVFEVRQGYKSKDSKRQNADIANAAMAYTEAYLPCVVLLSTQMDEDLLIRYRSERWAILLGRLGGSTTIDSTYVFMRDVIGYDLAGFFERHKKTLRTEVDRVLDALLKAE
jgi:hypothetical protein